MNVVGTQVARPDRLGTDPMVYGGITKWTSPRKSGGIPRVSPRFSSRVWRMSRLTQDRTAKPVSRDHILRRERGQGISILSVQPATTSRIGNLTRLIRTLITLHTVHSIMYPECSSTYVLSVHSCYNTVSAALLSSPVISTNEDPRIR